MIRIFSEARKLWNIKLDIGVDHLSPIPYYRVIIIVEVIGLVNHQRSHDCLGGQSFSMIGHAELEAKTKVISDLDIQLSIAVNLNEC